MSKYSIDNTTLTAIADAIRAKGGTSDPILTEGMAAAIAAIKDGSELSKLFGINKELRSTFSVAEELEYTGFYYKFPDGVPSKEPRIVFALADNVPTTTPADYNIIMLFLINVDNFRTGYFVHGKNEGMASPGNPDWQIYNVYGNKGEDYTTEGIYRIPFCMTANKETYFTLIGPNVGDYGMFYFKFCPGVTYQFYVGW